MVFGAFEALKHHDLVVIPVCVNYSQPDKFRSTAFYNVGDPIPVRDFAEEFSKNPARAYNRFLEYLTPRMKSLLTHIDDPRNDLAVLRIEEMCKRDLISQKGLDPTNLLHDFQVVSEITSKVNVVSVSNPPLLGQFKAESEIYFEKLRKNGLRDWLINPLQNTRVNLSNILLRLLVLILGFPIYAIGLAGNFIPLILSDTCTRKVIRNREFYSSFALGFSMILFLLYYGMAFTILFLVTGRSMAAVTGCVVFALCGWFNLYYHPWLLKTIGMTRIVAQRGLRNELEHARGALMHIINKF
jgi:hypothetical protein